MLYLAFLWHMHQPWYLDPQAQEFALPWVRLHGIKDYLDMGELLAEFPSLHATLNVTPCLLRQLELYAQGVKDELQRLSERPAERLDPQEIERLKAIGFLGVPERTIHPYPRYYALWAKANRRQPLTTQEIRDLQVWSNLAWMDPRWRRQLPEVKALLDKGSGFTEEDKDTLFSIQTELLKKIIPTYRSLTESGQVELTTSPWAHPILPLLQDTEVARQTNPGRALPSPPFRFPEDVRWHLYKALQDHLNWFGTPPKGLWPSEGSVSLPVVAEAAEAGFRWIATDEAILWKSLGLASVRSASASQSTSPSPATPLSPPAPDLHSPPPSLAFQPPPSSRAVLYRPHRMKLEAGELFLVFRDSVLSDLIGFVYHSRPTSQAVSDFLDRLKAIEAASPSGAAPPLVLVALDGENAWEFYPEDGEPFLRNLYRSLSEAPWIRCTTVSEYLGSHPPEAELNTIAPGSWIRGEFSTWIGHEAQNRAWEELLKIRRWIGPEQSLSMAVAEGSDWFWWLGPEHSSPLDPVFDRLFRLNLKAAWTEAGKVPPPELEEPLKATPIKPSVAPTGPITPVLDGEITSYFEWLRAGEADLKVTASAMARARPILFKLWWGCDADFLYLRLDPAQPFPEGPLRIKIVEERFEVEWMWQKGTPQGRVLRIRSQEASGQGAVLPGSGEEGAAVPGSAGQGTAAQEAMVPPEAWRVAAGKVLELSLPLRALGVPAPEALSLAILVQEEEGSILERHPEFGVLKLPLPEAHVAKDLWSA